MPYDRQRIRGPTFGPFAGRVNEFPQKSDFGPPLTNPQFLFDSPDHAGCLKTPSATTGVCLMQRGARGEPKDSL